MNPQVFHFCFTTRAFLKLCYQYPNRYQSSLPGIPQVLIFSIPIENFVHITDINAIIMYLYEKNLKN
jgi:hypothetical protein